MNLPLILAALFFISFCAFGLGKFFSALLPKSYEPYFWAIGIPMCVFVVVSFVSGAAFCAGSIYFVSELALYAVQ